MPSVDYDWKFKITPQELDLDFGIIQPVTEKVTETITENDHSKLINRELPDQHPMEAVSGLNASLTGISGSIDGLNTTVTSLDNSVKTLNSGLDTVEKTVTQLETSIQTMPAESMTNSDIAQIWNSVMG